MSNVHDVNDRMQLVREVVNRNAERENVKRQFFYDRTARMRSFTEGDRVLFLQPKPGKPIEIAWTGPWTVVKKDSDVNYTINTDSKRKPYKTIHINLLKPDINRSDFMCSEVYTLEMLKDPEGSVLSNVMPTLHSIGTDFNLGHIPIEA